MHFPDPFRTPGRWFRGSLHIHSTASDGELTRDQVVAWYRDRGYDFIALTDHRVWSPGHKVGEGFLVLSGIEVDGVDPQSGPYHIVGIGLGEPPERSDQSNAPLQASVDGLCAAGGRVIMAHPYWTGQLSKDLMAVENCIALEVYNGGCEVDDAKGYSTVHWDDLLAAGRFLWGVAVDDAHWRDGSKDAGLGWIWVKARALVPEAILEALDQGHFYASTGPEILALEFDSASGRIWVRTSPVAWIDFVGDRWFARRVMAPDGATLTEAEFRLRPTQRYVRVACQDTCGRWAWSNPIALAEEG
jgi:hypothetical protein